MAGRVHGPMAAQPARASIDYMCRLLRGYGIDHLTPELVRQAKFNSPVAYEPLLQALQDLTLCVAAGLPHGCADSTRMLKLQVQQEAGRFITPEGVLLTFHLLVSWGCPASLVVQLNACSPPHNSSSSSSTTGSSRGSSRFCLLALAWLIGHAQLFDRALQHFQLPQQLLHLLPPYSEDTATTQEAQHRQHAAATAAQLHCCKVQQMLQAQAAAAAAGSGCWQQVQTAAHQLSLSYRVSMMRLQLLTSLQEGREKLLHEIKQLQYCTPPSKQRSSSSSSTGSASEVLFSGPVLTAFELHLLHSPELLAHYRDGVQQACNLLQQQIQCVQAAQTFFTWVCSVLDKLQQDTSTSQDAANSLDNVQDQHKHYQQQNNPRRPQVGRTGGFGSSNSNNSMDAQGRISTGTSVPAYEPNQQLVLQLPTADSILPLLKRLPAAGSPLAAQVLQRVQTKLQQALLQASSLHVGCEAGTVAQQVAQLGLDPLANYPGTIEEQHDNGTDALLDYYNAAAAALVQSGVLPATEQQLVNTPKDIYQQLHQHQQQQQHSQQQWSQQQQFQAVQQVWHRKQVTPEQMFVLVSQQQSQAEVDDAVQQQSHQHQQRQHQQFCSNKGGIGHSMQPWTAADGSNVIDAGVSSAQVGQHVAVFCELQRLQSLAIIMAKQLAKVRASNASHMATANDMLFGENRPQ